MPLKSHDPFVSSADRLDAAVNPYVGVLREAAASGALPLVFGPALTEFPGRWRERIAEYHELRAAPRRLVVEIGCHKGQTLLAMAAANPDVLFVGLDITFKRVVTTAQRANALGLRNVFTALANARAIDRLFAPGELDGCVIFFPDPWVKKARQAKNRLLDPQFCEKLGGCLSGGAQCWLKTDQQAYFTDAGLGLDGAGLARFAEAAGVFSRDYGSAFEQRFHGQNLPTFTGKWVKPAAATALA